MEIVDKWKGVISGGVGGICNILTGHPFDTVKVRLQVDSHGTKYSSMFDCARKILLNEGIQGFFKGMATPIVGVVPIYSTIFFGYHLGQDLFRSCPQETLLYREHCMAGMMGALLACGIIGPGERIKCLLQVQDVHKRFAGPVDCCVHLYREHGLRGIFKGTLATFARDVPATGVYFTTYEFLKRHLSNKDGKMDVGWTLLAGGLAGVGNWTVALPADVIKSRLQADHLGMERGGAWRVVGTMLREEGVRGFYKGATPVFCRAFPANAACFLGYETTLKCLNFFTSSPNYR